MPAGGILAPNLVQATFCAELSLPTVHLGTLPASGRQNQSEPGGNDYVRSFVS